MPEPFPLLDANCTCPGWAKERTRAGLLVCRICNPRENENDPMFA